MVIYLFDFDGTLVDSTRAVEKALQIAIEKTMPAVIESDLYEDYYKALFLFIKGKLTYQYLGVIHELVAQGTIHEYYKLMPKYIKDYPFAREVIRELRKICHQLLRGAHVSRRQGHIHEAHGMV